VYSVGNNARDHNISKKSRKILLRTPLSSHLVHRLPQCSDIPDPATRKGRRPERPDGCRAEGQRGRCPSHHWYRNHYGGWSARRPYARGAHGQRGRCPSTPNSLVAGFRTSGGLHFRFKYAIIMSHRFMAPACGLWNWSVLNSRVTSDARLRYLCRECALARLLGDWYGHATCHT